jgi:hypothetical protein
VLLTDDTDWEEIRELVTRELPDPRAEEAHRTARLATRSMVQRVPPDHSSITPGVAAAERIP